MVIELYVYTRSITISSLTFLSQYIVGVWYICGYVVKKKNTCGTLMSLKRKSKMPDMNNKRTDFKIVNDISVDGK